MRFAFAFGSSTNVPSRSSGPVRRLLVLPPLSALLVAVLPAVSEEGDLYASAVRIVQDRYLWPETLDAPSMLRGAVERLEDEVDWLVARPTGEGFLLEDGDGRTIARVEAGRLPDLPEALRTIERAVASAPWPLDPDLQLDVYTGL